MRSLGVATFVLYIIVLRFIWHPATEHIQTNSTPLRPNQQVVRQNVIFHLRSKLPQCRISLRVHFRRIVAIMFLSTAIWYCFTKYFQEKQQFAGNITATTTDPIVKICSQYTAMDFCSNLYKTWLALGKSSLNGMPFTASWYSDSIAGCHLELCSPRKMVTIHQIRFPSATFGRFL